MHRIRPVHNLKKHITTVGHFIKYTCQIPIFLMNNKLNKGFKAWMLYKMSNGGYVNNMF